MTANIQKAIIAALLIICLTVLMATKSVDAGAGMPTIALLAGYVVGNGNSARKGAPAEPIIKPSDASIERRANLPID